MTFLTWPIAALAAAVLIPALVILYFLKLRRRDMEVSSTLLWKKAIQDLQANAPFQKLRNNILLILQLLALIVALLAIAQPEFRSTALQEARQIILIDRSASMSTADADNGGSDTSATDAAPTTRLDAAKKKARALVDALKEPGLFEDRQKAAEAMIIVFDSGAEVRQVFTSSKPLLRAAIDSIEPTQA
ncbi:MAG: VWA domain-containing protein, partial [Phycisphaerales bacterium]|nr:VWA domain-containing protein [Phycisphaerales bacterium]